MCLSDAHGGRSAAPPLLRELPIMHRVRSRKILYGLGFAARSLANLPTATRGLSFFFFFFMNSLIAIFHELHIKPAWRNAV